MVRSLTIIKKRHYFLWVMLTSAPDVLLVKNAKKEIFVLKISLSTLLKSRLHKFKTFLLYLASLISVTGALFSIFHFLFIPLWFVVSGCVYSIILTD
jgi:hypothetical protein